MTTWIRTYLIPPAFPDDAEKNRVAWLLYSVVLFSLGVSTLLTLLYPFVIRDYLSRVVIVAPMPATMVFLLWLIRRGRVRLAALLFITLIWFALTASSITGGGVRSVGFSFYLVGVIMASFLLGPSVSLGVAALSSLVGLGLVVAENAGLLAKPITYDSLSTWILQTVNIVMGGFLISLANRSIREALARARRNEALAAGSNEELQRQALALQESEQLYRTLFEGAPLGIALVDRRARLVAFNDAILGPGGYTRADLEALASVAPLFEDRGTLAHLMKLAQQEGALSQAEVRLKRKDGTLYHARLSMRPVQVEGNELWQAIVEDISIRKETEERLHHSLEEVSSSQRMLLALSQVGETVQRARTADEVYQLVGDEIARIGYDAVVLVVANDGETLAVAHHTFSDALISSAERMTGLSLTDFHIPLKTGTELSRLAEQTEPVFSPVTAHYISENLPRPLRPLANQLASQLGVREAVAAPIKVDDALHGVLFLTGSELRQGDVPAVTVLANMIGVSLENAFLVLEIQRQARQLQHILDSVPEGILVLDEAHRIQLANPAGQTMLSTLADAIVGERLTTLGGRPLAPYLATKPGRQTWRELALDGTRYCYEVAATALETEPLRDSWVVILRDVSDEREQQRYQQAQERLATVGHLAAGVAHDFNNIMAVITLYAQLLLRAPDLSPGSRERLATIQQQADRAASLIAQILDFSRRSVMELTPIELLPFLKELLKLLQRTFPENITIRLEEDGGRYIVQADPTRLQQVFMNLSVNARDAMPDGGELRFVLSHDKLEQDQQPPLPGMTPGEWLKLTLADNGSGIPQEHLRYVFEPFFTTKAPGRGTGLGLAQAYGIVKQHGGHIDVSSVPGEGTTFTLYLPVVKVSSLPVPGVENWQELPASRQNELILVVEDEMATRLAVRYALETLGYRVLEASDGSEAVELFGRYGQEIALILSDLVMPDMGGEALFKALNQEQAAIKMVMMTGYPLREGGKELLDQGAVAWVSKPFSLQTIAEVVYNALAA